MNKIPKAFRLDSVAVAHLEELQRLTGSTQASIIEQSLAVYRALLANGLTGAQEALEQPQERNPETPPTGVLKAQEFQSSRKATKDAVASSVVPSLGLRASGGGRANRTSQERLKTPPAPPQEPELAPNQYKAKGQVYVFSFPVTALPPKGSDLCPCGSGEIFARCHKADFKRAVGAGLTGRG